MLGEGHTKLDITVFFLANAYHSSLSSNKFANPHPVPPESA